MSITILTKYVAFPPPHFADEEGLLAIGGDLSPQRLLQAYRHGIFPWYNEDPILWWCPDPRFVLFPHKLKVSKSMGTLIRKNGFQFSTNKCFDKVIENCKSTSRSRQEGTWITNDVQQAYITLHKLGYAHSAEAWRDGELVGGLYGIRLGNIFFGESMFSHVSNASKFAFMQLVNQLKTEGVVLIDCQVYTEHLESLGAEMIARNIFLQYLASNI